MSQKSTKRDYYLPRPQDWKWEELERSEAERRLQSTHATAAKIEQDLTAQMAEVTVIKAGLFDPEKSYSEVQALNRRLDDVEREVATLRRYRTKVSEAIVYMERLLYGAPKTAASA